MRAAVLPERRVARRPGGQRGVILLFALIALVVLLIGAAALIRSFNTSLFQAGNIAFKRDLQNQGERAVGLALAAFKTGGVLATADSRSKSTTQSINYSAQVLSVDAQGIPDVLTRADGTDQVSGSNFVVGSANDVTSPELQQLQITMRFVIDRLCASAGNERTLGATQCALASTPPQGNSGSNEQNSDSASLGAGLSSSAAQNVLYRLSVRIRGPRQTQSFFQSTFSVPS